MTRAKFMCVSVKKQANHGGNPAFYYESEFAPVSGGSEENKQFFAWTPSGSIRLSTVIEDHFKAGKEYYVDFTEYIALNPPAA